MIDSAKAKGGLRVLGALVCLLLCVWMARGAALTGMARLLAEYGVLAGELEAADLAVRWRPEDPEVRYARAVVLRERGDYVAATAEQAAAAELRPLDYLLQMELGRVRDLAGDREGAITAYLEAARLAPFYARPRWQLGNALLRAGRAEEAFVELRSAAQSDPSLRANLIDLSWGISQGDAEATIRAVSPQTSAEHLALARFLIGRGRIDEAMRLYHEAGEASVSDRRNLLTDLLAAKRYPEAFALWASLGAEEGRNAEPRGVHNGSFEESIRRGEPGFGWQPGLDAGSVRFSVDSQEPREGAQSLRLEFSGSSAPGASLLSQLALVEPGARYRLSFAARTEEIVTGGALLLIVNDASTDRELARVALPRSGGTPWQVYSAEFSAGTETQAVRVILRRENCAASGPCPIFGRLWLDDFALRRP